MQTDKCVPDEPRSSRNGSIELQDLPEITDEDQALNWPGSPDETTIFPKKLLVDYIRVYKDANPESIEQQLFWHMARLVQIMIPDANS